MANNSTHVGRLTDDAPSMLVIAGLAFFTFVVVTARLGMAEIGIVMALAGLVMRPSQLRFPAPFWWAISLVAWAFATSPWAIAPDIAQATAVDRLKVFVVFLVVINTLRTERHFRHYVLFILACFMLSPVRGALTNYLHGYTRFGRALWNQIYANPNDLAATSLLALGLSLSVLANVQERRWIRWGSAACAIILVVVVLLTQSRGVFVGMIVGFGLSVITLTWKQPRLLVSIVAIAVVGMALVPHAVWTRLSGIGMLANASTIAQADPEKSAAQRWEIQKVAFRIFADYPLTGIGLGCYPIANKLYAPKLGPRDTHNTYLNLSAELGLPGLLLWLGLIGSVFRHWRRANAALRQAANKRVELSSRAVWIKRAIVGFLVSGFFGSYSGITMLYLLLGVVWSAASLVQTAPALPQDRQSPTQRWP